jgi:hypothetical protein
LATRHLGDSLQCRLIQTRLLSAIDARRGSPLANVDGIDRHARLLGASGSLPRLHVSVGLLAI